MLLSFMEIPAIAWPTVAVQGVARGGPVKWVDGRTMMACVLSVGEPREVLGLSLSPVFSLL